MAGLSLSWSIKPNFSVQIATNGAITNGPASNKSSVCSAQASADNIHLIVQTYNALSAQVGHAIVTWSDTSGDNMATVTVESTAGSGRVNPYSQSDNYRDKIQ